MVSPTEAMWEAGDFRPTKNRSPASDQIGRRFLLDNLGILVVGGGSGADGPAAFWLCHGRLALLLYKNSASRSTLSKREKPLQNGLLCIMYYFRLGLGIQYPVWVSYSWHAACSRSARGLAEILLCSVLQLNYQPSTVSRLVSVSALLRYLATIIGIETIMQYSVQCFSDNCTRFRFVLCLIIEHYVYVQIQNPFMKQNNAAAGAVLLSFSL